MGGVDNPIIVSVVGRDCIGIILGYLGHGKVGALASASFGDLDDGGILGCSVDGAVFMFGEALDVYLGSVSDIIVVGVVIGGWLGIALVCLGHGMMASAMSADLGGLNGNVVSNR